MKKNELTIDNLRDKVLEQIKEDVHCGDYEALSELIKTINTENLLSFLPSGDYNKYKHLQ